MFVLRKWKHTYALWYLYVVFQPILMEQGHYAVDRVILNFNLFLFVFKNLRTLFCKKYHWSCCHSEFALIALNNRSKWPSCKAIKRLLFKFASIEFEWMRYVSLFSIIVCIFNLIIIIANKRPFCALQFIQKKKKKCQYWTPHRLRKKKKRHFFTESLHTTTHNLNNEKNIVYCLFKRKRRRSNSVYFFWFFTWMHILYTNHTYVHHTQSKLYFFFVRFATTMRFDLTIAWVR